MERLRHETKQTRNGKDRTEAEEIKKRWQEYTEEQHKKHLNDPGYHDGVVMHLELDILKCEVKRALGSITTNKTSGGDGIPVELFQMMEFQMMACLITSCAPDIGLSIWIVCSEVECYSS